MCLGSATAPVAEPPQVEISNGIIQATLYLPDQQQGYYRGTRFDWSGAFKSLVYKQHTFVDQWFETYDPYLHDAINGPVEEFVPLGFAEAKAGDPFVKIGVGVLQKPDDKPYAFLTNYPVIDQGQWALKQRRDHVDFIHTLSSPMGYGYVYTKTVKLTKGKPELVLDHSLKNTGKLAIQTSVYDHNFFILDKEPTGPGIEITFPFALTATGRGFGELIQTRDNRLVYSRGFQKKETVFTANLQGHRPVVDDYSIRIDNLKTGAGVQITSDHALEKLVYWACATTSCPEPYIRLEVSPGQTVRWKIMYSFYEKSTR